MGQKALEDIAKAIEARIEAKKDSYRALLNTYDHIYRVFPNRTLIDIKYQLSNVIQYSILSEEDTNKKLQEIVTSYCDELVKSFDLYSGSIVKCKIIAPYTISVKPKEKKGDTERDVFEFIQRRKTEVAKKYLKEPIIEHIFGNYDKGSSYQRLMKIKDDSKLEARLSTKDKRTDAYVFNAIDSAVKGPLLRVTENRGTEDERKIIRRSAGQAMRGGGGTNLGHEKISAVAKRLRSQAAEDFLSSSDLLENIFIENQIKVTVSKYIPKLKKALRNKFIGNFSVKMELFEESQKKNFGDSSEEKKQLNALGKDVKQFLNKLNWAQQEGSSTPTQIVQHNIREQIEEDFKKLKNNKGNVKLKLKGPSSLNIHNSSAATTPISKTKKTKSSLRNKKGKIAAPSVTDNGSQAAKQVGSNWSSIIPIINAKLPERVVRNMGSPGLVNRTGRLAGSAKVVGIQTTKEGYPSIVYDYERDPYDVFDRSLGRQPWNTPARDPRALVDKSVREIVQEMAIGRFYTRRA